VQDFAERVFRPVAMQRGLEFSIEVAPGAPLSVTTDRQLLHQILKNLLANAFKFTERGRVGLRIEPAPAGLPFGGASLQRASAVMAFAVSDTGIGISSAQLERIFEAFQQADTSITRKYGGTGLGLTISREYARILGGEVAVQSTPNVGSTFTLYLPLLRDELQIPTVPSVGPAVEAPPLPLPAQPITVEDTKRLAGTTILIVEDDARNLYSVTSLLERFKVHVIPANSAREAFARLREHPDTDLVLMDIMMPEMDGYQTMQLIRQNPALRRLPIIALTAKAMKGDREKCLEAGASDYLAKPVNTEQLLSALRIWLHR
jgi:two-component system chemotaxis sensor kinase CheA